MNRALFKFYLEPFYLGIPFRSAVVLIALGTASFLGLGSIKIPVAFLVILIILSVIERYDNKLLQNLVSYLMLPNKFNPENSMEPGEKLRGKPFGDLLPWCEIVDAEYRGCTIIVNKDGSLQSSFKVSGIDALSNANGGLDAQHLVNRALTGLSEHKTVLNFETRRVRTDYTDSLAPVTDSDDMSFAMKLFQGEIIETVKSNPFFKNELYLTIVLKPQKERAVVKGVSNLFVKKEGEQGLDETDRDQMDVFKKTLDRLIDGSGSLGLEPLSKETTLRYLHSCVSPPAKKEACFMEWRGDFSELPGEALVKSLNPMLGNSYIFCVGVKDLPAIVNESLMHDFSRLDLEYRWMTRIALFHKEKSLSFLKSQKTTWRNASLNFGSLFRSMLTQEDVYERDQKFETSMAERFDEAIDHVKSGDYALCSFSSSFLILDRDEKSGEKKAQQIQRLLSSHGYTPVVERLNTAKAWISSIPGTVHINSRQFVISTDDASRLLSMLSYWEGANGDGDELFITGGMG